jgi:hypothetical protein
MKESLERRKCLREENSSCIDKSAYMNYNRESNIYTKTKKPTRLYS